MVQVTQSVSQAGSPDTLHDTMEVNPTLALADLLGSITAREVSAATGLPLARTVRALADLHQSCAGDSAQEVLDSPLTATERAILEYALQAASRPCAIWAHA